MNQPQEDRPKGTPVTQEFILRIILWVVILVLAAAAALWISISFGEQNHELDKARDLNSQPY